jgi:hypothetical protein
MTEAPDGGDLEKIQVRNLEAAATTLLERAAAAPAGRAALTLVPGAGGGLRSSRPCWRCGEACTWPTRCVWGGDAAGPAGPGAADDQRRTLGVGSGRPPADPTRPAPVGELGGRCHPLDRGRGTIQMRETPGDLSGSKSETHQHFLPTVANCCQSLLLDPDATISIDLHKRPFLAGHRPRRIGPSFSLPWMRSTD